MNTAGVQTKQAYAPLWPLLVTAIMLGAGVHFTTNALVVQSKAVLAQILLERAWQKTLETQQPVKAWAWADTWPIARLEFPTLHRSSIVLKEAGGEALAFGPAHVGASPLPGNKGVSVIGGHRDTHFAFIKDLKTGDTIALQSNSGMRITFKVTGTAIVHAHASGIDTRSAGPELALVTCYPFDGITQTSLRYVVFAQAAN